MNLRENSANKDGKISLTQKSNSQPRSFTSLQREVHYMAINQKQQAILTGVRLQSISHKYGLFDKNYFLLDFYHANK